MLKQLQKMTRDQLYDKYSEVFNEEPSAGSRKEFLLKRIAWQLQTQKYGGYSPQTIKQLEKLAQKLKNKSEIKEADIKNSSKQLTEIKAGTKLIREFKGIKHEVIALDKGFEYKGKKYRSLSAIANEITGSRWNGKIFFGGKSA